MSLPETALDKEIARRRTFAIISHPDAGKTTLTEKLRYFGGAIQVAGEVPARKASRHATSDWKELERQRGASHACDREECLAGNGISRLRRPGSCPTP